MLLLLALLIGQQPVPVDQPEPAVRLFYPSAAWQTVLEDVAEASGLTLVAPKLPQDRVSFFSRDDFTPEQALRLINDELTQHGARAMVRGEYLIVLEDDTFQPTFPRFKYGSTAPPASVADELVVADRSRPHRIQLVDHTTAGPPAAVDMTPSATPNTTATAIEPTRRSAREIGRVLYDSYRSSARLVDDGPAGLPAFEVQVAEPITVAIDAEADRIVFVGSDAARDELIEVVETLDATPRPGETIRLVAGDDDDRKRAAQLRPAIADMLALQDTDAPPTDAGDQPASGQPSGDQVTELLDQLRGDVAIESLDSLGLLILRGNERDIEAVEKIIGAIESAGAGTSPAIHLRELSHIDGEAVAELITEAYEAVDTIETRPARDGTRVVAIPVVRPNAVLVVAPATELEAVLALVDRLDQPVAADSELKVIPLRGANASEAVETIREFYEERGGLGTRATVSADPRTNSLLVRARPNDLAELEQLIASLDAEAAGSLSRVRLYPLQFAEAGELADLLTTIIEDILDPGQTGGLGQQSQQSQRSVALEFLAGPGAGLVRSGVLSEVRISGDPRSNALVVVSPPSSQPLFEALIDALDRPAGATAEIKVFTLTNADASAAADLLGDLFIESTAADGDGPPGLRLTGAEDAASNLLPVSFSVDVRTNSILAVGGPDSLTVVEAILLRLDSSNPRQRVTQVIKLKNAPADEVAEAINIFLESQRELAQVNPDLVSTVELLDREVIVVPEPVSNNLLISATYPYFDEILGIAAELDARPAQVVIQALLVEVELDNTDEFGIELGFQDDILFDRSTIDNVVTIQDTVTGDNGITQTTQRVISQTGNPGFLFNNPALFPQLGNNIGPGSMPATVGEQVLSNFGVGRVSGDLNFGGLVLSASSDAVSILIRALSQRRDVHVLSRPQIRTLDGQLAEIQVGQQVPIINGVTISGLGVANPNIIYDEAGIILSVTPRISPDGQIVMEVVAERSAYIDDGVPIFTDVTTGNTIFSPIKNVTVARSTVSIKDGQTVVLGGMITQNDENITRKVPYLGDIPIIGRAFRYDIHNNLRTELLMFLTPRVVTSDFENEVISEVEAGRLHFFREEAEAVHGPLFGVPADGLTPPPVAIDEPYRMQPTEPSVPLEDTLPIAPHPSDLLPPTIPAEPPNESTIGPGDGRWMRPPTLP